MELKFVIQGDSELEAHETIKSSLAKQGIEFAHSNDMGMGTEYTYVGKEVDTKKIAKYLKVVAGTHNVNIVLN